MALFSKKKTEDKKEEKGEEKISEVKPAKKPEKKAKEAKEIKLGSVAKDIISAPWITEKSHAQMAENKYIFRVRKESDKKKIKSAIESLYSVKVINVNVINIPPKKRVYGRREGTKSGFKKAIVTLKEGDKIELFKGV